MWGEREREYQRFCIRKKDKDLVPLESVNVPNSSYNGERTIIQEESLLKRLWERLFRGID